MASSSRSGDESELIVFISLLLPQLFWFSETLRLRMPGLALRIRSFWWTFLRNFTWVSFSSLMPLAENTLKAALPLLRGLGDVTVVSLAYFYFLTKALKRRLFGYCIVSYDSADWSLGADKPVELVTVSRWEKSGWFVGEFSCCFIIPFGCWKLALIEAALVRT